MGFPHLARYFSHSDLQRQAFSWMNTINCHLVLRCPILFVYSPTPDYSISPPNILKPQEIPDWVETDLFPEERRD